MDQSSYAWKQLRSAGLVQTVIYYRLADVVRTGGREMLSMMGGSPNDMAHHT